MKNGEAVGLVVYRLDRLAHDLIVQETLHAEIRRLGAEVFTTSAGEQHYLTDDADDPSRKLIRQILGAVSEYERSMIRLRMRSGRRRKAIGAATCSGRLRMDGALTKASWSKYRQNSKSSRVSVRCDPKG